MHSLKLGVLEDWEEVLPLFRAFHRESPYSETSFDEEKVYEIFCNIIQNGVLILLVKEGIVGFLAAFAQEQFFNREKMGTELGWYILPEHRGGGRKMLKAYEYWARLKGCKGITLVCMDMDLTRLYERQGFVKKETAFFKEFKYARD